jgi:hypothetical protein
MHEFCQQQFIQLIELLRIRRNGFAMEGDDDGIPEHVDDIFAVLGATDAEVWLEDETIVVVFEKPFLFFWVEFET